MLGSISEPEALKNIYILLGRWDQLGKGNRAKELQETTVHTGIEAARKWVFTRESGLNPKLEINN